MSAFFSSNSSIKKANSNNTYDFQNTSPQPITSSLIQTASSAFQPINSLQNLSSNIINRQTKIKSQSILMDIPKHKPLECGQKLTNVHISHPQSPSIIHVFLHLLVSINNNNLPSRLCYKKISIQLVVYFMQWQHIQNFNQLILLLVVSSTFYLVFSRGGGK